MPPARSPNSLHCLTWRPSPAACQGHRWRSAGLVAPPCVGCSGCFQPPTPNPLCPVLHCESEPAGGLWGCQCHHQHLCHCQCHWASPPLGPTSGLSEGTGQQGLADAQLQPLRGGSGTVEAQKKAGEQLRGGQGHHRAQEVGEDFNDLQPRGGIEGGDTKTQIIGVWGKGWGWRGNEAVSVNPKTFVVCGRSGEGVMPPSLNLLGFGVKVKWGHPPHLKTLG